MAILPAATGDLHPFLIYKNKMDMFPSGDNVPGIDRS